jgi:hypothetical protein
MRRGEGSGGPCPARDTLLPLLPDTYSSTIFIALVLLNC